MGYTVAITKSGQMTLPKELRQFLGLDGVKKVTLEKTQDKVVIKKKLGKEEFFDKLELHMSDETRRIKRRDAEKSVSQMIDEYRMSKDGRKEFEDKYERFD